MPVFYTNEVPFSSLNEFRSCSQITIQSPDSPDADSLAAAFALFLFFKSRGKKTAWLYAGESPFTKPCLLEMAKLFSLPITHDTAPKAISGPLITVGCCPGEGAVQLTAEKHAVFGCRPPSGGDTGVPGDIRPYLTSCSTLVYQMLRHEGFAISTQLGTALLFGLHSASNGFSEIRFPLDRDMKDEIPYDEALFKRLTRTNLSLNDLHIAAKALSALDFYSEEEAVISNVLPCDLEVLRFIGDLALHVHKVNIAITFFETKQWMQFSIRSDLRDVHAGRLAARMTGNGLGYGSGTREKAGGTIHCCKYQKRYGDRLPLDFFREELSRYRLGCDVIDCNAAPSNGSADLFATSLRAYQKRPLMQAFVRCSVLFPKNKQLLIRMLEGDIHIDVMPETYLMIGVLGEVYPIKKKVFDRLYEKTGVAPKMHLEYEPSVIAVDGKKRTPLLQHAEGCISREKRVLACLLQRPVKLFTLWDRDSYIEGEPGDWLVRQRPDKTDQYIVKSAIFSRLYRAVNNTR